MFFVIFFILMAVATLIGSLWYFSALGSIRAMESLHTWGLLEKMGMPSEEYMELDLKNNSFNFVFTHPLYWAASMVLFLGQFFCVILITVFGFAFTEFVLKQMDRLFDYISNLSFIKKCKEKLCKKIDLV